MNRNVICCNKVNVLSGEVEKVFSFHVCTLVHLILMESKLYNVLINSDPFTQNI